ncbi:MAG: hypothetical protein ACKO3W_12620, partial [bacterium]
MKRPSVLFAALSTLGLVILALQFLLPIATSGSGALIDRDAFDGAEASYAEGMALRGTNPDAARTRFVESALQFESLLATHDAAGLYFNRANALLEAGRTSEAIASYLAAERRLPGDTSIEANLAEARSRVARVTDRPESGVLERAQRLWSSMGTSTRTIAAALFLWAAAFAGVFQLRRAVVPLVALGLTLT